jgi:hypothetical protein
MSRWTWTSAIDILPAQEGILVLRHAHTPDPARWIRAQRSSVLVSFAGVQARSHIPAAQEHGRRRGEQLELALVSPVEGRLLGYVALYGIDQIDGRGSIG